MSALLSLQSLIDTHSAPFMVLDREFRVVAVNSALARFFEIDAKNLIGNHLGEFLTDEDSGPLKTREAFFRNLEPFTLVETRRFKPSVEVLVRGRGYPLHGADGTIYLGEIIKPLAGQDPAAVDPGMLGRSPAFLKAVQRLERAAKAATTPVLIVGESGTGKEMASRYVHDCSQRRSGPFVTVDCTILGQGLIESELFGHEKGAFTGSAGIKKGLFELADGGSLFLDELGELPLDLQAKLLRAVEYGTFRRVGGVKNLRADVRVLAATNRSLEQMVRQGSFRQDLYYRLAVLKIELPPLRKRREDILLLTEKFLADAGKSLDEHLTLSPKATERLLNYGFPGNIRELRNLIQVGAALCDGGVIRTGDLEIPGNSSRIDDGLEPGATDDGVEPSGTGADAASEPVEPKVNRQLKPLHQVEAEYIRGLLERFEQSRTRVAEHMGISTRTLSRKIRRYRLA